MSDPKQLGLYLFDMATIAQYPILGWKIPGDRRDQYTTQQYWKETARLLEEGFFDGIFLADIVGVHDLYRGGLEVPARESVQFPNLDPYSVAAIVAGATEHLGIGITASTSYSHPFELARRFSTLDHLSAGRVGWNIVLSHTENSSRNFGLDHQLEHGDRYRKAQEFLDVAFALWEGSWEDGAVIRDRGAGGYVDPERVRYIDHEGDFFRVKGPHLVEPSPQRTPVIYQATISEVGLDFALRNSEFIFTAAPTPELLAEKIRSTRAKAPQHGREPGDVKFIVIADVVVGRTADEVSDKLATLDRVFSLPHLLGKQDAVLDYTAFDDTVTLGEVLVRSGFDQRVVDEYREVSEWADTIGRSAELRRLGQVLPFGLGVSNTVADAKRIYEGLTYVQPRAVGTPEVVADQIEEWLDLYGIDAINLRPHRAFDTARDFVELVVPELQRRGRLRTSYRAGETLRERHFPGGPRLNPRHPGARYRGAFAVG